MREDCLILLGGDAPQGLAAARLQALLQKGAFSVAADRGAEHLRAYDHLPDSLVGDFDSLDTATLAHCRAAQVPLSELPQDKDWTDGEAAFRIAFAEEFRRYHVFGAFGGRPDHQLTNLLLPLAYHSLWQELVFYGDDCTASYCFGEMLLSGQPGDTVSLIPLTPAVRNIHLLGFRFPLNGVDTVLGSSLCMSNRLSLPQGIIRFDKGGVMLVVHLPQSRG